MPKVMINHCGLFFLRYMILFIIFNCYESYEGFRILTKTFKKPDKFSSDERYNWTCYNNLLQNRLLNVKVKSPEDSGYGIFKWKKAGDLKRSEIPPGENKNSTEDLNFFVESPKNLRDIQDFKSDFIVNKQYQAIQSNYFTIPKKTVELLQLDNMCPRRNAEIHPCKTIFKRMRMTNTIWPREIITASCQCNGQRCSVVGVNTCVTLVSRITVVNHKGIQAREYVPVACACMALKGISAKEMIPLIV